MGIAQTEPTEVWVLTRPNRPKLPLTRRKARNKFFPDQWDGSHRTPMSTTQVGLVNACLGSRTSSWAVFFFDLFSFPRMTFLLGLLIKLNPDYADFDSHRCFTPPLTQFRFRFYLSILFTHQSCQSAENMNNRSSNISFGINTRSN